MLSSNRMKAIRIIYALLPFLLLACMPSGTRNKTTAIPYDSLRNGDIVFRRGCSYTSYIVLANDDSHDYSHIGIVQKSDSGWCVIHAVNDERAHPADFDRVKIDKIEDFFSPARATMGEIMHSWLNDSLANIVSQQALQLLNDNSELYCTEFIYFLYKNIGEDITEGRRTPVGIFCFPEEIIFPSDIHENKKLKSFCKF